MKSPSVTNRDGGAITQKQEISTVYYIITKLMGMRSIIVAKNGIEIPHKTLLRLKFNLTIAEKGSAGIKQF